METRIYEGEEIVNLNNHIVKVKMDNEFVLFKRGTTTATKPKVIHKHVPDKRAPATKDLPGGLIVVTENIENFPMPQPGKIFLTNRDVIVAARKIEQQLRDDPKFKPVFEVIDKNPETWRKLIRRPYIFEPSITSDDIRRILKFVGRHDLRAPGVQVRVDGEKSLIDHCLGLFSDFE